MMQHRYVSQKKDLTVVQGGATVKADGEVESPGPHYVRVAATAGQLPQGQAGLGQPVGVAPGTQHSQLLAMHPISGHLQAHNLVHDGQRPGMFGGAGMGPDARAYAAAAAAAAGQPFDGQAGDLGYMGMPGNGGHMLGMQRFQGQGMSSSFELPTQQQRRELETLLDACRPGSEGTLPAGGSLYPGAQHNGLQTVQGQALRTFTSMPATRQADGTAGSAAAQSVKRMYSLRDGKIVEGQEYQQSEMGAGVNGFSGLQAPPVPGAPGMGRSLSARPSFAPLRVPSPPLEGEAYIAE